MDATTFLALTLACAPQVHADTARALVRVESAFNPWAIGVVGGALRRQPRHQAEAIATAQALQAAGWNFSVGLGQINQGNVLREQRHVNCVSIRPNTAELRIKTAPARPCRQAKSARQRPCGPG